MTNLHNICRGAAYTYTFGYLDEDYRLQVMVTSPRPFAECGICGCTPVGYGCYHICPNSVHYYTAEQERYDDQFYGMDDERERYAATIEPSQYEDEPVCYMGHEGCYDLHTSERLADEADWEQERLDDMDSGALAAEIDALLTIQPTDTDDIPF